MKITFNNKKYEIESKNDKITIDSENFDFDFTKFDQNTYKINLNGQTKLCFVAEDNKSYYVFVDGEIYTFEKFDESEQEFVDTIGKNKTEEIIKPPMPGSVVKVLVENNQQVSEGDPIVIVEAMKMEITLYTTIDGVVKEINVSNGMQVDSDTVLVRIERI